MEEKRKGARVVMSVRIGFRTPQRFMLTPTKTKNISVSGLSFLSNLYYKVGTEVDLYIYTEKSDVAIHTQARVARLIERNDLSNRFEVCLEYLAFSQEKWNLLDKLINPPPAKKAIPDNKTV